MKKRAIMTLALGLWVALWACQGKEAPAPAVKQTPGKPAIVTEPPPSDPVEVVLWHSYRMNEKAALEKSAARYNESQGRIRLKLLNVPYDAFVDKVTIATPRGQGPDVFIFAHNLVGDWVDNYHILEPISQKVPKDVLKRFVPKTVKALVYKQSLYGLPMAFKSLALFYDPERIAAPPATGEELARMAVEATDKAAGRYGLAYEAGLLYFNAPFIHGFGGVILDGAGRPQVDSPSVAEALGYVKRLVTAGALPRGVNSAMVTSLFNAGNAAMVISGPWFVGEIDPGRKYEVALLPKMKGEVRARPFLGSEAVFMSSYSRHKKEALEAMLYLTSDEMALLRLKEGRQTVANEAAFAPDQARETGLVGLFRAQAENSVLMPSRPEMQVVWSTMDVAINKSVFGETSPAEALAEARKKIEADIAKMGQ
ncbi:MAG: extracellular solute-binding protein [Deltaproteobacteria bacterium]|nr:extracellular solute-binding protein [Deltaproteobacteria bacterium]